MRSVTIEDPKWPGVAERIAQRIRDGEFPVGSRLPARAEHARAEGVTPTVLKKALDRLARIGVVEIIDSVGTLVRQMPAVPLPPDPPPVDQVAELERRVAELESWREQMERPLES